MLIVVGLGEAADVDAAVSVYERPNFASHRGVWPSRAAGVKRVGAHLRDPAAWFLLAKEGQALVGMASAKPLRGEEGMGAVITGGCFLSYLYVIPERWGEGIGGIILDELLAEAKAISGAFTCGRTKTISLRSASTAAAASRQLVEPPMLRANGRPRFQGFAKSNMRRRLHTLSPDREPAGDAQQSTPPVS